MAIISKQYWL